MGANAQTTVPSFTASQILTAQQMNQSARTGVPVFANSTDRDAAFGGTGEKTLAEGQLCYLEDSNVVQYYDGSSWATLGPTSAAISAADSAAVNTNQTTTSGTYTDLATVGPAVTLTTGTEALVFIGAMQRNDGGNGNYTGVAVSGASTIAAADADALYMYLDLSEQRAGGAYVAKITGLTPGSNTFTLKYRVQGNTGYWYHRSIMVLAL